MSDVTNSMVYGPNRVFLAHYRLLPPTVDD